jgi:CRISPR system Cascade subunit CasB
MTSSPPTRTRYNPPLGLVGTAVHDHISRLQRGYLADHGPSVATLARLRRAVGKPPGEVPDVWDLIGMELLYEFGETREPAEEATERAEEAVHAAVTLWALHQQSHHQHRMHRRHGNDIGAAVRRLSTGTEIDEPVRKRFVRAGTATTPAMLADRLRGLVVLFRRESIPLDYALLADQLYEWQKPGGLQKVRRSWGRAYFAAYRYDPNAPADPGSPDADSDADNDSAADATTNPIPEETLL